MIRIRLRREGRRNRPFFWIVVADAHSPQKGVFLEKLGHYDPLPNPPILMVDREKVEKWLKQGAQPTEAARKLLVKAALLSKEAK